MTVRVKTKTDDIVIDNADYVSFERNFVVVKRSEPRLKHYFKLSTVISVEEKE